ncbi:hypothetical protein RSAG8_06399, partial [Rhizoctonia solani AG-8 WAC10335]
MGSGHDCTIAPRVGSASKWSTRESGSVEVLGPHLAARDCQSLRPMFDSASSIFYLTITSATARLSVALPMNIIIFYKPPTHSYNGVILFLPRPWAPPAAALSPPRAELQNAVLNCVSTAPQRELHDYFILTPFFASRSNFDASTTALSEQIGHSVRPCSPPAAARYMIAVPPVCSFLPSGCARHAIRSCATLLSQFASLLVQDRQLTSLWGHINVAFQYLPIPTQRLSSSELVMEPLAM